MLAHQLEVAARVEQLVVGALRVRAHLLLAQADEGLAQLLLAVGEHPVRIPVVAQTPEGLAAPHLLRHPQPLVVDELVQTRRPVLHQHARVSNAAGRSRAPTNGRLTTSVADGTKRARGTNGPICPSRLGSTGARGGGGSVATAQVEEQTLLKAMTWWDGFVVALANPAFLIAGLGGSIGALGTGGAFLLWSISICLGALQNNIHAELASMFPNKSGGVALYAHEAWRKYTTLIGPLATFGYWIGWSVVLAVNGLVAGTLITAEWFSDSTWTLERRRLRPEPADRDRHRADRDRVAVQRLRRAAGGVVRLRDRARCCASPRSRSCSSRTSRATGRARTSTSTSARTAVSRSRSCGCTSCAGRRTGSRWSRRSRPSTTTPSATRAWRCASAALFSGMVYVLLPARGRRHPRHGGDRGRRDADRVVHAGVRRARRELPRRRADLLRLSPASCCR